MSTSATATLNGAGVLPLAISMRKAATWARQAWELGSYAVLAEHDRGASRVVMRPLDMQAEASHLLDRRLGLGRRLLDRLRVRLGVRLALDRLLLGGLLVRLGVRLGLRGLLVRLGLRGLLLRGWLGLRTHSAMTVSACADASNEYVAVPLRSTGAMRGTHGQSAVLE